MFAIIKTGGKQYKVKEGDVLDVELLGLKEKEVTFSEVLLISDDKNNIRIGTPFVSSAKVKAKVIAPEIKGEKIYIIKYKPKKRYRRKTGHRQKYTRVKIEKIIS
ncbi:MAG: 50S ribosomal protein L21 [Patescibacteria group bacterium]